MRRLIREVLIPGAVAVAMAFVVQAAVAKPYEIPTRSMYPTIKEHDRVIANRLVYRFRSPERGDIIVFTPTEAAVAACNPPKGVPFVKRVIGVPGDTVEVRPGKVLVNGTPLDIANARTPNPVPAGQPSKVYPRVPARHVLVLGDNRPDSCDSHMWRSTPPRAEADPFVPFGNIIGQAEITYWPPTRWKFLG